MSETNQQNNTKKRTKPTFNAVIERLSDEGRGITKNKAGKTIFIDNALVGEEVIYTEHKRNKNYNEAVANEIIKSSSDRITPECEHFELCGGCAMQHVSHDFQVKHKQEVLLNQLSHFGKVTPNKILEPVLDKKFNYRHKARLGVRYVAKKEKVLVGFREKSTNFITDIKSCKVLHQKVGDSILDLSVLIASLSIYKSIPQIEVAIGDIDVALIFRHLEAFTEEDNQKLISFGEQKDFHIYLQPKGIDSIKKIYPADNNLRLSYKINEFDVAIQFHPTDFTQVNPSINRKLISLAIELLDVKPEDNILDLFCGIGNFSLPIARKAKHVIGIEGSKLMVERAFENAKHNNISNADFFAADLTKITGAEPWLDKKITKALIDPPRSGADKVIYEIAKLKLEKIVYVSCNISTLARDAGILVNELGYSLDMAGILDMFPQTAHAESIAVFTKLKN